MPRRSRLVLGLATLAATATVGACAKAGMAVPTDLAGVEPMPVEGRRGWRGPQRASFGPYETADVERSWTKGGGWRVGIGGVAGGSSRAAQEYSFRFLAGGVEVGTVRCTTTGSRGSLGAVIDVDVSAREALECRQDGVRVGDEPAWELSLQASRDRHLEGFIRADETRYAIRSTGPGGKYAPADARGFEVRDGDRTVAAVEVVNDGAVWLAADLAQERRTLFATVAAALLLWEPLDTD